MSDNHSRDRLYAIAQSPIPDFAFDDRVAEVFPDMIRRSVPGYATVIGMLGLLAEHLVQPHSYCYDLGCSLGAATLSMRRRIAVPGARIIAVDNSAAMVERCREYIDADASPVPVEIHCRDIREVSIERASLVVLNFTLQFIPPPERQALIDRICAALVPGGALVLSEKLVFAEEREQRFQEGMHLAFKRANGYSDLEISQKRAALEKVLAPDTVDQHLNRMKRAGFRRTHPWFQCFNFASLIAFK